MTNEILKSCTLCPRECHVNRSAGELGFCRQTDKVAAARASLHMWEEPCISGKEGSGTVFFSGCSLGCVFCQNYRISDGSTGKIIGIERLAKIFMELQEKKANNINLVTPTHFVIQIIEAIQLARRMGFKLPVVYNTSGYEKQETLKLLEGYVDIYLPDLKYASGWRSKRYSGAENYFMYAKKALKEMVRQIGDPVFDERGIMKRGVIVRHLVLPGGVEDSKKIIQYLYETYHNKIYISIMNQFTPVHRRKGYEELNRKVTEEEYNEVVNFAVDLGVENGFIQEGETAQESFIPDFNTEGI